MLGKMKSKDEDENLKLIVSQFNSEETFDEAVIKLKEFRKTHPNCDLTRYLQTYPKAFVDSIMSAVDRKILSKFFI